ncbi:MAG: membrane protein insertase YidC [Xanthomonadales bacterium]|nr:membrane protein insertase YidC [Xanthomonadales bacterium]
MANLRPVLIVTLLFLAYLIWVEWQKDYGPAPAVVPANNQGQAASDLVPPSAIPSAAQPAAAPGDLPQAQQAPATEAEPAIPEAQGARELISVTTDVLDLQIDPVGGTVVAAKLRNYPVSQEQQDVKVQLFSDEADRLFIAQSGLLSRQGGPNHATAYESQRMEYALREGTDELRVPLTWSDGQGLSVTKTFIFRPGAYDIEVRHTLENRSAGDWSGSRYEQLQRSEPSGTDKGGFSNPGRYSFNGIGFYSPEEKFEKVDFDEVADEPYQRNTAGGWLAMIQHYFFAAWIPPGEQVSVYSTQEYAPTGWPRYIARSVSPAVTVPAGQNHEFTSRLFVGPKLQDELDDIAPGLQHTVNYGIFTVFSKPLFWLLSAIHNIVGNWGWAIVFLTVLIKLAFFKLTEAQYKSMARMRKLQPRVEALKERYGDDRQRMSQAMMELYKKEKVNPLGGCLPILVQIPIFIALYWVLLESVELRQAPFIGWITNLSVRDPYFILPALNAFFMIMTQRLTPTTGMDPMQAKMMKAMPVVFSVMFALFPAGLVLYWATNAGLSLAQQWYITRKIAAAD